MERSQRGVRRGEKSEGGRKKKRVTDSKGEKSVSELCLHNRGDEMKMISPVKEVACIHVQKTPVNLKLGRGF